MIEFVGGLGPFIAILVRLIVPFAILRWPFWGGLAASVADALDVALVTIIGQGDFISYDKTDKVLDMYFLVFLLWKSRSWERLQRYAAYGLFGWRTIGFVLFEITGQNWILFVFPNLFLHYWLFEAGRQKWFPGFTITRKRLFVILLVLLGPKLVQEWVLHVGRLQPWNWIKNMLGWP